MIIYLIKQKSKNLTKFNYEKIDNSKTYIWTDMDILDKWFLKTIVDSNNRVRKDIEKQINNIKRTI